MKRNKGTYGYLKKQLKFEIIKTVIFYALCLLIFFTGYFYFKTRNNLMTVVAAVGCLPAGKSTVSMIMYMKARACSEAVYNKVQNISQSSCFLFDLYLTAYKDSFQLSCALVCNKHVLALTEDYKCNVSAGEEHILRMMEQNGIKGYLVKIFTDEDKFFERVQGLTGDNQELQTSDSVMQLLKNISL